MEILSLNSRSRVQIHDHVPAAFDYNVSHDSDWVILFWSKVATRVGVDVMRIRIPWEGETEIGRAHV